MNARKEMGEILEEWLQLTQEEGAAIQAAAWPILTEIQSRKAALQDAFSQAERKCAEEAAAAGVGPGGAKPFCAEVRRLISLVTRNGVALAAQRNRALARQELIDQTNRNLRKIQRSYARPKTPVAWHSYS